MKKFQTFTGLVAPLDRANIDTDAIIPKQFLKSINRTGFGPNLFDEWRYLDYGEPGKDCGNRPLNPDFILNQDRYKNASILLTGNNFGCGSSREHAPWALYDYGFRCILAPSFADIFYNNCRKNGILAVVLRDDEIQALFEEVEANEGCLLTVDLPRQNVTSPEGKKFSFEIDSFAKNCLLEGLDDIGWTMQFEDKIQSYERHARSEKPWLFISN